MLMRCGTRLGMLVVAVAGWCTSSVAIAGFDAGLEPATVWSPDVAVLNQNLGIDATYVVEDLEDYELIAGLAINVPPGEDFFHIRTEGLEDEVWDGAWALQNSNASGQDGRDVRFIFEPGITRFGVGISHLEQETAIVVNGQLLVADIRNLPGWTAGGPNVRNGYLWITATDGDVITSVVFDGNDASDSIFFDHLAARVLEPEIIAQPPCVTLAEVGDGPQELSIEMSAGLGLSYQWRRDGVPLENGGYFSGVTTDTLLVVPQVLTEGTYDVVVTATGGFSVTSDPSVLAVRNPQPADINGDGMVNVDDLLAVLASWSP